ncbi:MAG TPA: hypothetical protein VGR35_14060 [Tepidisphaeraceae bacterium]|nr:hypothetical protein [Tepidisphaeraceae bacterium]
MRFLPSVTALLLFGLASTGCATRTETFEVSVRNDSSRDVVAWLTKVGGPEQEGWRSPESIAINFVVEDEELGGVIIPPGKTARTGKQKAKLNRDSRAVLRVYRGRMKMSEMLANSKGSPNRADMILDPGVNRFVVTDSAGKLIVTRTDPSLSP